MFLKFMNEDEDIVNRGTAGRVLLSCCSWAVLLFAVAASAATPPDTDHWVGTWATAPVAARGNDGSFGAADTTYREIVHVSLGGSKIRVVLTNEFGSEPLTIGAASVAPAGTGGAVDPAASHGLTFAGRPSVTIPAGAMMISDPVAMNLPQLSSLAVSIFVPAQAISRGTLHWFADQTNYIVAGNAVTAATLNQPQMARSWYFLKGVQVAANTNAGTVVTFGDSITDGAASTPDKNARWPDVLAQRLLGNNSSQPLGVLNEGIGGNRILTDGAGVNALARFDRDVIAQAGVKYVIILEGINDIGGGTHAPRSQADIITADQLIAAMQQMTERAHQHGIKVICATLTPFVGAGYQTPQGEAMRTALNQWIRTNHETDGFIDFEKATQDPANPSVFLKANDSGDHLHPADAGYAAMGNAIDLKLLGQ
ncbi:SGNH/GDSL hydrolase family protein [Silvibacterium acidisoli]|uniref:SGNH/GDSL hydrolase family protein n=1 Tax=Acidobacteriaceae bacterium ZG23-2 TaxID=2883246 RepID=UPI00406C9809